jgi:cyclophilin family peptidyl-prolyl cis-trans isomerase/HEAT repeat protein
VNRTIFFVLAALGCARPQTPVPAPPDLQSFELARTPSAEVRALLRSDDAHTRARAALAVGRIGDPAAIPALEQLLLKPGEGELAAWALGRIEGGQAALSKCLAAGCPALRASARNSTDVEALLAALRGPAAEEAGLALGVLARSKTVFPETAVPRLAEAAARPDARAGAVNALSRLPKSAAPELRPALEAALRDGDAWTRSLAARAAGRHGLPASLLPLHDPDWRVRVEAARALATAADAKLEFEGTKAVGIDLVQESPHVAIALLDTAATLGVLAPDPARFEVSAVRCAAAQARDRVRKQILDTPRCESGWHARARAGALAAELGLVAEARKAFADEDGRVRAAAAGAAGKEFSADLQKLLSDPDPYVVQDARGALAKLGDGQPAPRPKAAVPPEQRPGAHVLRLRTVKGELVVDLRTDVAPLTSGAIAALAARGFYDGLDFHRVVPDFVVQGGDPRGDGDGGPGWTIPDEHSPLPFLRGSMGIATDGPETGGSQVFFCHSPQPHLDGRYTVTGQLRPESLPVLDALQIGDRILSASID